MTSASEREQLGLPSRVILAQDRCPGQRIRLASARDRTGIPNESTVPLKPHGPTGNPLVRPLFPVQGW